MASKKKQKGMVFRKEGATTPAAAPAGDHPPACFAVPKPGKASEGGMEQSALTRSKETDMMSKPNMHPSPNKGTRTHGGLPAVKHPVSSNPQSENLSPDSICKGIRVTLDNNSMWNEFFRCKTEMILTKQGSRMFPYCRFRISGLQPSKKYSLLMDIQPLDNSRYRWSGKSWQVAGKAECHIKSQPFAHPESPSTGQHWMQNPVSFYKLKLTNNNMDQEGNTILHPMHRYLPRLHVVQTDKAVKDIKLNGPSVVTFTFPQTEFMAVTAYQNSGFAQLKVDYNPFAKGLKEDGSSSWGLKLNSGKDLLKDEGTTNNEQHTLKKSLKSLLANHKPRSSKAVESKPSVSCDLQKNSTTNRDQSDAMVTEERSCSNSRPAQKLFSELIREAHVSLQRCNLEQLGINNSSSHRAERTNTRTNALKSIGQDVSKTESVSVKTHSKTSSAKKSEVVVTKKKVKEDKDHLNELNCKDNVRTDCSVVSNVAADASVPQNSSVDSDQLYNPIVQSEVKVKQHKRPAPLPLPALALFLKQHSAKSKKPKTKPDSPLSALPPESLLESQSSAAASASPQSDRDGNETGPSKDLTGDITKSNKASKYTSSCLQPDVMVFNTTGQAVETSYQPSSSPCPDVVATKDPEEPRIDHFLASISGAEDTGTEPTVPDGAAALNNSDQSLCTLGTSTATISSTLATSGSRPIVSPPLDTVLSAPDSPQTPTITESSTLPSDPSTLKSDHLLPDPECYSFHFEPMSPASSPEPLPSLPTSLTLQLNSSTSDPTLKASPPKELLHTEDPATSVFKWHTVLPPPEPYIDTSFTAFQSTPQALPLASVASPLPCQTPSHPEPQTFDASTSTPPPDAALSFQENEQSLPFPAELSPLALQLPLSPTFSSIDSDGLSPTPSITDLVQFFSTNDDLGMGEDFSNTEAVAGPCPLTSTVEANAHEPPRHVQPGSSSKPCKCKRKSWRQKLAKADVDQKMDDSAYARMQPNLEEVEEQLFISFTSKEALKLHVVDSSEETPSHPQMTPEHLQQTTDASENDKSSLPDSIHPNNFPAKLWRLVNNPANKAVCWDSHGKAIIIDQLLFEKQILSPGSIAADNADAFKTTNFSSFVRQLNLYGFRKPDPAVKDSHHPPGENGMYHQFYNPNFKQNHPELLTSLRRLTVNNKAKIQAGLNVSCRHPSRSQRGCGADDSRDKHEQRAETADSLQQKIIAFEKVLLRDLKLMRHRQVIHPVLQAVGLKMNLLDPTLAIDLQYLGVHLPLPPPGVSVEPSTQELPPPQGVCSAFVSRTGKTTDVTQIKGWREKFTASEAPPTPAPSRAEAGPSSDLQKKNLSAFCSDMLDEYLENEAKLIDERAASFSQPVVEPVVYELPTRSTSYVRTLHSVLRKESGNSPTSDLISGFIPPSKRPKLNLKEPRASRRDSLKQKGPKLGRPRSELGPAETKLDPKPPSIHVPDSVSPQPSVFKRRKKLKPRTSSQTLSALRSTAPPPGVSEDMAPLESDSELGGGDPNSETCRRAGGAVMTRALLRQKDLEDGVVWEGKARTSITEERAAIALSSLFTLMGFVSENPTAPIQLVRRRAPPCLNEFCRLGCVCSSLSHISRISHCGRSTCMLGCSCLKQKVVLLKNLDGSDSSPSHHGNGKKRRRKRRMKMAYILKEADSVSQPAERVRTLWKRDSGDSDPDPIHVPKPASVSQPTERILAEGHSSCARVRGYRGKKKIQKQQDSRLKPVRQRDLKETNVNLPGPPGELVHPSDRSASPAAEPPPRPSKRLIILAECKWVSDADRNHVLKTLCERMAWDQLDKPFWVRRYLISPMGQTMEWSGSDHCIQYKIHISRPKMEQDPPAALVEPVDPKRMMQQQDHLQQVAREAEPVGNWQQEVKEEETEPPEDWQREVEEGDIEEEAGSVGQVRDGRERHRQEVKMRSKKKKKKVCMGLPFLTGICPAGLLSANRKQPGGTDQLVQVNAKLYPLARIQLGRMGALHPANRLAAYLTGRVGSNRKQEGSLSCPSPSKPPQKNSGPTPPTVSTPPPGVSPHTSQPSVAVLTLPTSTAGEQVSSSAASPVTPPPNPPQQLVMVQVPGLPGVVPVPALKPCPLPPGPTPPTQRMILKPVQGASGVQYYRRPDGKLVQLVINQLRPVAPNQALQRGSSSPSVVPPSCQTPVVSVINKTLPVTTVTSASSSPSSTTSYPSLSALQASSVSPLPSPLCSPSVLPQKSTFTFKILPADSSRKPITVTCTKVPPRPPTKVVAAPGPVTLLPPHPPVTPVKLISLKPSAGQGVEPGAKAVTVGPAEASIPQRLPPPQTATQNSLSAEVTHPELETASDLVDLDVVCVDDETEIIATETVGERSSSETENSSDFGDETDREEEKESAANSQRLNHNMLEKQRRVKLLQLFERLRRETGLSSRRTSKISTLKKAVQVIQELRRAEADLQQKKKLLMERREDFLRVVAPQSEVSQQVSGRPQGSDTEPSRTGSKDAAVIEVVDLLDETNEPTDNLSDGERVVAKTTSVGAVTEVDDGVQSVAMERKDKRRLARNKRNKDSGFSVKPLIAARSPTAELRPGKTEPRILKKLHPLSSPAANQQPAAGGRASDPLLAAATDSAVTFNNKPLQAPPSAASAPPITTPALTPVQRAQVSQTVLQVLSPTLVAPGVSHSASVLRDRVRTVPNILSRTKNPPPLSSVLTKPVEESFQALVPADVLSLVNAALPGQPVLTLSPLMAGPTVLQTSQMPGMASVTLNIPSLTNQQIHLTSLPHPPTGKIYSSSAPVAIGNLTGTNLNNLLQLVHPSTTRQQQEQQHLRVPAGEPRSPPQPDSSPASSLTPPHRPLVGGRLRVGESSADSETLTSLLHEIVFLNQQAVATVTTAGSSLPAGQQEEGPAHSPWLLQVDPEDTVAMETEEAWPRDQEMTPSGPGSGPISGNTMGGVLAPPPLLQMKVGGANVVDPASRGGAVGRDGGRGGRREGGMAWKPMPRLVPLGLRGNPPS